MSKQMIGVAVIASVLGGGSSGAGDVRPGILRTPDECFARLVISNTGLPVGDAVL